MEKKVGNDYFAPGFTSYKNQLQYQTYNITKQFKNNNELVVVVGGGWAVGAFTYKRRNRVYAKRQALLCELRIKYEEIVKCLRCFTCVAERVATSTRGCIVNSLIGREM